MASYNTLRDKTKQIQKEVFIEFLNSKNLYAVWSRERASQGYRKSDQEFLETTGLGEWISGAFLWNDYWGISWNKVHDDWMKVVNHILSPTSVPTPSFHERAQVLAFKAKYHEISAKLRSITLPKLNLKFRFKYLIWRLKFRKVKFYTLRDKYHCDTCDARHTCELHMCPCNQCEQLKLKRKKK